MAVFVKMPLDVYLGFVGRCPLLSREYAALKNSVVQRESTGAVSMVDILCDNADAELLRRRADQFYPAAAPYIQESITNREIRIVATEYRREPASQTWHFCSNCSQGPSGFDFITSQNLPDNYEICNECVVKNQQGECK